MKIIVATEHRQGRWNNTSFETLAAAQQIAGESSSTVSAVALARIVANRRLVMASSGNAHRRMNADRETDGGETRSPDLQIALAENGTSSLIPKLPSFYNALRLRLQTP